MFSCLMVIPLLYGFSSDGSFPKPLSAKEEKKYLEQYQNGTEAEQKEAKDMLVMHNLRLVAHIAKKYYVLSPDHEDFLSIGIVGLLKAISTYDMEKSIRLATYASRCIENEILMSLRAAKKYQNDVSIFEPIGSDKEGNEITMLDVISEETVDFADQIYRKKQMHQMCDAIHAVLTPREKTVLILRYGLQGDQAKTQQEVADLLGISRSYISRIEKKALKKVREYMEQLQG